jgi:hypothetical protein
MERNAIRKFNRKASNAMMEIENALFSPLAHICSFRDNHNKRSKIHGPTSEKVRAPTLTLFEHNAFASQRKALFHLKPILVEKELNVIETE